MKKLLLSIFACVLCIPSLILIGCKNTEHNSINISRYFQTKATYQVYNNSTKKETQISEFTHSLHNNQQQYLQVSLTGNSEWLYKMNIDTVSFDIYANQDSEVQFILRFSNLNNGDTDSKNEPKFKVLVDAKANKPTKVSFTINDFVKSYSSTTTVKIEVDGAQHFTGDNADFKFDIKNFKVFGNH